MIVLGRSLFRFCSCSLKGLRVPAIGETQGDVRSMGRCLEQRRKMSGQGWVAAVSVNW